MKYFYFSFLFQAFYIPAEFIYLFVYSFSLPCHILLSLFVSKKLVDIKLIFDSYFCFFASLLWQVAIFSAGPRDLREAWCVRWSCRIFRRLWTCTTRTNPEDTLPVDLWPLCPTPQSVFPAKVLKLWRSRTFRTLVLQRVCFICLLWLNSVRVCHLKIVFSSMMEFRMDNRDWWMTFDPLRNDLPADFKAQVMSQTLGFCRSVLIGPLAMRGHN